MAQALVLAMLLFVAPAAIAGQALPVLHIRAVLTDANGQATPVARHALLISDNPPTREPRRVVTSIDGTADVRLRPGNYTVESDAPVRFQGTAYHWTRTVAVVDGRESVLELTLVNATAEALTPGSTDAPASSNATDPSLSVRQWVDSVVQVWSPTAHGSGFLADAAGFIVTNQRVVGDAATVEVQLSRSIKVAGMVLEADRPHDMAVVRIDSSVMASIKPVPLGCPRTAPATVARGQEIIAIAAPLRQERGMNWGTVTRVDARLIASDLTLATGGTGGPVFAPSGELAGMTALPDERGAARRGAARIVRIEPVCDLLASAARKAMATLPPSAMHLPVEPMQPAPVATFKEAVRRRAGSLKPYRMAAADFDVAFIPPILNYAAQSQPGVSFSNWSDYVADIPPVLFIRVTPKMVESMWARVARGAATTQGMALPPITRMGPGFLALRAFCDGTEVPPVHRFKLELRVSETDAVYEGLYAFDPAALGPECATVALSLYSEKEPAKEDRRIVDPKLLQQIRRDVSDTP